jgi:hypothetical protein
VRTGEGGGASFFHRGNGGDTEATEIWLVLDAR